MGIGAALLIAALFKISVNGMVLNLKSLIIIMGINLVYGFAVPGIDNAGHIGGAVTGLVIALAYALAYRQRLAITLQNMPSTAQDIYRTTYIDSSSNTHYSTHTSVNAPRFDNEADFTNNSSFNHDSAVNSPLNSHANHASLNHGKVNEQQTTKSTFIWQLLPWLVMLLISIGFTWWWQDIHQQILQVLAAIE